MSTARQINYARQRSASEIRLLPTDSGKREETLTFIAGEYSGAVRKNRWNIIILHHSHWQGAEKNAFASAAD